jgi:hypothetical protein
MNKRFALMGLVLLIVSSLSVIVFIAILSNQPTTRPLSNAEYTFPKLKMSEEERFILTDIDPYHLRGAPAKPVVFVTKDETNKIQSILNRASAVSAHRCQLVSMEDTLFHRIKNSGAHYDVPVLILSYIKYSKTTRALARYEREIVPIFADCESELHSVMKPIVQRFFTTNTIPSK